MARLQSLLIAGNAKPLQISSKDKIYSSRRRRRPDKIKQTSFKICVVDLSANELRPVCLHNYCHSDMNKNLLKTSVFVTALTEVSLNKVGTGLGRIESG